jgi:extradiol dioxygenase family protein
MFFATAIQPESDVSSPSRAARAFYCEALRGRQISRVTDDSADRDSLWFVVAGTLIQVGPDVPVPGARVTLTVDDPHDLAERCWDAGFSVSVGDTGTDVPVFVFDPFGRTIELTRHEYAAASSEVAAEEG